MNTKDMDFKILQIKDSIIKEKYDKQVEGICDIYISQSTNDKIIDRNIKENQSNKLNKCNYNNCNKKLNLCEINLRCKCGNIYCNKHRHANAHECEFDYKTEEKNKLQLKLDKLSSDKIIKL